MLRVVLILACFAFIFCDAATELSAGAKQCFEGTKSDGKKRMEGLIRRVKLSFCDASGKWSLNSNLIKCIYSLSFLMLRGLKLFLTLTDRIKAEQGFAFDDLEIRVGNVLFNTNPKIQRTVLMKNTQVQICMYGKVKRQNPQYFKN